MDYTYLNQLNVADLLHFARDVTGMHEHIIRALADRLEEYADAFDIVNRLEAELADAEHRADSWREESAALQRQLDRTYG
jgi:hypothetical protein